MTPTTMEGETVTWPLFSRLPRREVHFQYSGSNGLHVLYVTYVSSTKLKVMNKIPPKWMNVTHTQKITSCAILLNTMRRNNDVSPILLVPILLTVAPRRTPWSLNCAHTSWTVYGTWRCNDSWTETSQSEEPRRDEYWKFTMIRTSQRKEESRLEVTPKNPRPILSVYVPG